MPHTRKKLGFLLILCLLIGGGILSFLSFDKIKKKERIATTLKTLPKFKAINLDSVGFEPKRNGKPIIMIYFNSDCEHCQSEAIEIVKNQEKFINTQILMLSSESLSKIKIFATKYKVLGIKSLQIAQISSKIAVENLGFKAIPHILIYDAKGNLQKQFVGETKIEVILKYL